MRGELERDTLDVCELVQSGLNDADADGRRVTLVAVESVEDEDA
jgi:hypothetical protein